MIANLPSSMPNEHRAFLKHALKVLAEDPRIIGDAAGGSFLTDSMDEFSDLDLILVTSDPNLPQDQPERMKIAGLLGNLLAGFTGDHVGEPRLLICLYGDPLIHVDLKFIVLEDLGYGVEKAAVLWEREGQLTSVLESAKFLYPAPDEQWIEDRFWVWVHFGAVKIARGELFETVDMLGFLRGRVLGPLALQSVGKRPNGLRKIETDAPEIAKQLLATLPEMNAASCRDALRVCADIYLSLRSPDLEPRTDAQVQSLGYLEGLNLR